MKDSHTRALIHVLGAVSGSECPSAPDKLELRADAR